MKLIPPLTWYTMFLSALLCPASMIAQDGHTNWTAVAQPAKQEIHPVRTAPPCFEEQDREQSKQHEKEVFANLPKIARFWLTEDVAYIISPEERCTFLHLITDQEREQFIEQFWSRRAPDAKTLDNSFKREHYERIVSANEKYGGQFPGWKTDRGRVFVMLGPPDSIESHRRGEKTGRPLEEGVETYEYSWEAWHYKHIEGMGENVELEFVDPNGSGDYKLALPPEEKDELIFAPPYNLGRARHRGGTPQSAQSIELYVGPAPTPQVQFKDLEAILVSQIIREQVRFFPRVEFAQATQATTLARVDIQIPWEARTADGQIVPTVRYQLFVRVSKSSGWVIDTSELTAGMAVHDRFDSGLSLDTHLDIPLAPGMYQLAVVAKNVATAEVGVVRAQLDVPTYEALEKTEKNKL